MSTKNNPMKKPAGIVITTDNPSVSEYARKLSEHLELKLFSEMPTSSDELVLRLDDEGLFLCGNGQFFHGDFSRMQSRINQGRLYSELLVKAAKLKGPKTAPMAVDATAGMGEDALLLAAAGYTVQLYERDPIIAALLSDTLRRASVLPELNSIVGRMHLIEGDSITALSNLSSGPDIILLDPMFPERQKSALIKKSSNYYSSWNSPVLMKLLYSQRHCPVIHIR